LLLDLSIPDLLELLLLELLLVLLLHLELELPHIHAIQITGLGPVKQPEQDRYEQDATDPINESIDDPIVLIFLPDLSCCLVMFIH
jgi:hypothetical protein